jgi:hypothetical protein
VGLGSIPDADVFPRQFALLASRIVRAPASDEELAARQSALHAQAAALLDELDQSRIFSDIGRLELTGSYISNRHEALRDSITDEQRVAVLRIKDVWFRRPSYPDRIGGSEIYTAVIDDGVRTLEEFRDWLADRELLDA